MPRAQTLARREDRAWGETGLLDRRRELDAIDTLLDSTAAGNGEALLLSGQPGLGKTRLYGVALDRARARGLLVLRAAGSELERDVAFGVAGQLVRGWLAALEPEERAATLAEVPEGV